MFRKLFLFVWSAFEAFGYRIIWKGLSFLNCLASVCFAWLLSVHQFNLHKNGHFPCVLIVSKHQKSITRKVGMLFLASILVSFGFFLINFFLAFHCCLAAVNCENDLDFLWGRSKWFKTKSKTMTFRCQFWGQHQVLLTVLNKELLANNTSSAKKKVGGRKNI